MAGCIVGGMHSYTKAFSEAFEIYKSVDEAKEGLIVSLEDKTQAQKELIESYEKLTNELTNRQELYKKLADKLNERQDDLKTFDTVQKTRKKFFKK